MLSSLNLEVKTPQYFVSGVSSSDMFLDKKTLFKIWVNLGLNLTIFRGTGPRCSNVTFNHENIFDSSSGIFTKLKLN